MMLLNAMRLGFCSNADCREARVEGTAYCEGHLEEQFKDFDFKDHPRQEPKRKPNYWRRMAVVLAEALENEMERSRYQPVTIPSGIPPESIPVDLRWRSDEATLRAELRATMADLAAARDTIEQRTRGLNDLKAKLDASEASALRADHGFPRIAVLEQQLANTTAEAARTIEDLREKLSVAEKTVDDQATMQNEIDDAREKLATAQDVVTIAAREHDAISTRVKAALSHIGMSQVTELAEVRMILTGAR